MVNFSCEECKEAYREKSTSGRENKVGTCDRQGEGGVPNYGTVVDDSDCPFAIRPNVNEASDRYPRRYVKDTGDDYPYVDTLSDLEYEEADYESHFEKGDRRRRL